MDLFKQAKETENLFFRAEEAAEKLRIELERKFVMLPYNMEMVEIKEWKDAHPEIYKEKVHFPILEQPEGFIKEDEEFYENIHQDQVVHQYTLKDKEGRKIKVEENASLESSNLINFRKGIQSKYSPYIRLKMDDKIILETIQYKIKIGEREYSISRTFSHKDMVEEIISPDEIAKPSSMIKDVNAVEERKFQLFMRKIGATQNITSLEDLSKSQQKEIRISDVITLKVAITDEPIKSVYLGAKNFEVFLTAQKTVKRYFKITPYVGGDMKLETQTYVYCDNSEERWEKGITVSEAIEIITRKDKEE